MEVCGPHTSINFRTYGYDIMIYAPCSIINAENISIGSHIIIGDYSIINGGSSMQVGDYVHIAGNVSIIGGGETNIGDFVSVGYGARIITGTDSVMGDCLCNPTVPAKYRACIRDITTLEDHAFIGPNVVIYPGVTIGEGSVIGAGSVVTKNVDDWGVYIGQPARRVKDRPKEKMLRMVETLLSDERAKNIYRKPAYIPRPKIPY